jgi:DNA-binding GntR family transcriptional regulator
VDLRKEGPLVVNAADVAVDLIRAAILDGRLTPGQRLKEAEVAEAFGISRTPVREALRILQNSGLLDASPNRGSVVRSYSIDQLREIYDLRILLEGYAARRAAMATTPELVQALRESCDRFEELRRADSPVVELVKENVTFHTAVIDAAASDRVSTLLRAVVELPLIYRVYYWYQPEQVASSERRHLQLVDAVEARDADRAELIMRSHILEASDVMQSHIVELGFEGFVDKATAELAASGHFDR